MKYKQIWKSILGDNPRYSQDTVRYFSYNLTILIFDFVQVQYPSSSDLTHAKDSRFDLLILI